MALATSVPAVETPTQYSRRPGARRRTRLRAQRTRVDRSEAPAARACTIATAPRRTAGVDRRQLDHRDVQVGVIVQQLAAQRFVESLDRMLGPAVTATPVTSAEPADAEHWGPNDRSPLRVCAQVLR